MKNDKNKDIVKCITLTNEDGTIHSTTCGAPGGLYWENGYPTFTIKLNATKEERKQTNKIFDFLFKLGNETK